MSEDLHNIDDLFKKALEENTDVSSSVVWENIDKHLDRKKVISISKKYSKLKWAAAALLLFSISMAMYSLYMRRENRDLVKQKNKNSIIENQRSGLSNEIEKHSSLIERNNTLAGNKAGNNEENQNKISVPPGKTKDSAIHKNEIITDNVQDKSTSKDKSNIKMSDESKTIGHTLFRNQKSMAISTKHHLKAQQDVVQIPVKSGLKENPNLNVIQLHDRDVTSISAQKQNLNEAIQPEKETLAPGLTPDHDFKNYFENLVINPASNFPLLAIHNTDTKNKNTLSKQHKVKSGANLPLSATIFFSPDVVSTNSEEDHPRFREDNRHDIKHDERNKLSSTIGVVIGLNIGKKLILESGITLSTNIIDIEPKIIYARPDNNGNVNYRINCSAGYSFVTINSNGAPVSGDSIKTLSSTNTLQYIGVPVAVKYKFTKGKLSLIPGLGVSANFLTKEKIETTLPASNGNKSVSSNEIQGLKSSYFLALASFGAEYKLDKNFAVSLVPIARIGLTSINNDTPVKTKLNSYGVAVGATLKF